MALPTSRGRRNALVMRPPAPQLRDPTQRRDKVGAILLKQRILNHPMLESEAIPTRKGTFSAHGHKPG
jgi:hypothetical protein